jgi:hypothetical protein
VHRAQGTGDRDRDMNRGKRTEDSEQGKKKSGWVQGAEGSGHWGQGTEYGGQRTAEEGRALFTDQRTPRTGHRGLGTVQD